MCKLDFDAILKQAVLAHLLWKSKGFFGYSAENHWNLIWERQIAIDELLNAEEEFLTSASQGYVGLLSLAQTLT
jgi:hypothetical protein